MRRFNTLMDVFKLLEKSNCRKCNEKTCLAVAASVFGGRRPLSDRPQLAPEIARRYEDQPQKRVNNEQEVESQLAALKARLSQVDFNDAVKSP